jgi:hypothetical protein
MIARIRSTVLAALLFAVAFLRNYRDRIVAFVVSRVPVSIDRTIAGLEAISAKLTRAEVQQMAIVDREAAIQEASYNREDAATAAAARAARVRSRVEALVA